MVEKQSKEAETLQNVYIHIHQSRRIQENSGSLIKSRFNKEHTLACDTPADFVNGALMAIHSSFHKLLGSAYYMCQGLVRFFAQISKQI